jgi:hypothetical protein
MNQSKFSAYWKKIRTKKISLIGLVLFAVGLFVLLPLFFILTNALKEPYEKYDYKKIVTKGQPAKAKVTGVIVKQNITFIGKHPKEISYEYSASGTIVTDRFQTIDRSFVLMTGSDSIDIYVLEGASVIKGMQPFSFPTRAFITLPLMLMVFGIIAFIIGFRVKLGNWNY